MVPAVEFAHLLCSRLCHDLVSPIGALSNGVELLADERDPAMREQCLQLLADSARQAASRLKFFRLAFGSGGGFGDMLDVRELQSALEGLFSDGKVRLEWMLECAALSKPAARVLLNLTLLAGDALLRGGSLTVAASQGVGGGTEIAVRASGPRLMLDENLRAALLGAVEQGSVEPRAAPAYLVHTIIENAKGALQMSPPSTDMLVLGASLPA